MDVLALAAARYAEGGYFVLIDGVIGPWFLDAFRKLDTVLHYIVLRPDLSEAIRRCRGRSGELLSDPVTISDLHQQLGDLGALERHALAVPGMSPDETCCAITAAVESGPFRLR